MSKYHIAQLNIATLLAPIDSPQFSDFVANLDRANALAWSGRRQCYHYRPSTDPDVRD